MDRRTLIIALSSIALLLGGCSRSKSFEEDEGVAVNQGGKSSATRLENSLSPKKKVSVFSFWNDTPVRNTEIGPFAASELRRALSTSGKAMVADQGNSAPNTEEFLQGDRVNVAQLVREGRRAGANVVIIGRVTKVTFRQKGDDVGVLRQKQSFGAADVEIKIFDVHGGREVAAIARSGDAASSALESVEESDINSMEMRTELLKLAIRKAMSGVVPEVVRNMDKMTWEGRVARIVGNKVYINAGKASGVIPGDILKVLSQGDDIYDPATGAFLGRTRGQLKGTLEVREFIGPDGAMTEIHSGGNFKDADVVQLY